MKDWEIIADNLSKAGWIWGCVSAIDSNGRTIWIADAHGSPFPGLLMRTVRNSALNNLRLNLSAARISPRQFPPDSRGSGLLT